MNRTFFMTRLLLLAATALPFTAQVPAPAAKTAAPTHRTAKSKKAAHTAPVNQVDINHATKDELKKLPGITDAYADKVIAGRPYLSKANLVSHKVLPTGVYESIKKLICVKQMLPK